MKRLSVRDSNVVAAALITSGPANWSSSVAAQSGNITNRQGDNRVTRLQVTTYYSANESGSNDCFADGTIENF
jgi:hypothetical protein